MSRAFEPRVKRKNIGQYRTRIDGEDKAAGKVRYIDDISLKRNFPGMLYAKYLRSPYAHAILKDFDATDAMNLPGVAAIISYKDPEIKNTKPFHGAWTDGANNANYETQWYQHYKDRRVLDNHARWVGDEVGVMVAAESENIAEEALRLIKTEWEVLPFVLHIEDALKEDAPVIHPEINPKGNLVPWDPYGGPMLEIDGETAGTFGGAHAIDVKPYIPIDEGDFEKALADSDISVEITTEYNDATQNSLDPWCCVSAWNEDGITIQSNSYETDQLRMFVCSMLDIPYNKVRCISPYVGGSFGRGDTGEQPFFIGTALLSKRTGGRPVKFRHTRRESFQNGRTRINGYCRMCATSDGTVTGVHIKQLGNVGAYADHGVSAVQLVPLEVVEEMLAHISNIKLEVQSVYTNKMSASCMRAIGNIQANFLLMGAIERLAEKLGMDPIRFVCKNFGDHLPLPNKSISAVLKEGAERLGWYEKQHKPGEGPLYDGYKRRGIGFSFHNEWHSAWQEIRRGPIQVQIKINPDGTVYLEAPTVETGPGSNSCAVFACADGLGIPVEKITWLDTVDTKSSLKDQVQTDSAVSFLLAEAVFPTAKEAKQKLLSMAAPCFKKSADEIDLVDGLFVLKNDPTITMTVKEVFERGDNIPVVTMKNVDMCADNTGIPFRANFAEVEVDIETGRVEVLKLIVLDDMGTVIFPNGAEGQAIGGQCQGLGETLTEEIIYDEETGKPLNCNWIDYRIHTLADFPDIEPVPMEVWKGGGEYGASGMGEGVMTCTPRAVAMAIYNAVGVRIEKLPFTADRVLRALEEKSARRSK